MRDALQRSPKKKIYWPYVQICSFDIKQHRPMITKIFIPNIQLHSPKCSLGGSVGRPPPRTAPCCHEPCVYSKHIGRRLYNRRQCAKSDDRKAWCNALRCGAALQRNAKRAVHWNSSIRCERTITSKKTYAATSRNTSLMHLRCNGNKSVG